MTKTFKFGDRIVTVEIDKDMKTHENDPFVLKKKADAEAFLNKIGLPEPYRKPRQ
jgi:hypothetical protein